MNGDDLVEFLLQDDDITLTVCYEDSNCLLPFAEIPKAFNRADHRQQNCTKPSLAEVDDILEDLEQLIVRPKSFDLQDSIHRTSGDTWDNGKQENNPRIVQDGTSPGRSVVKTGRRSCRSALGENTKKSSRKKHAKSMANQDQSGQRTNSSPQGSLQTQKDLSSKKLENSDTDHQKTASDDRLSERCKKSSELAHTEQSNDQANRRRSKGKSRKPVSKDHQPSEQHGDLSLDSVSIKKKSHKRKLKKNLNPDSCADEQSKIGIQSTTEISSRIDSKLSSNKITNSSKNTRSKHLTKDDKTEVSKKGHERTSETLLGKKKVRPKKSKDTSGNKDHVDA